MFQCMGLGTHETGGCGEDWYHPGCLVGQGPKWFEKQSKQPSETNGNGTLPTISEDSTEQHRTEKPADTNQVEADDEDPPLPDGFPAEEAFDTFICYKCVEAYPWIKRYAGTPGFLAPVFFQKDEEALPSKKRKLENDDEQPSEDSECRKRIKNESGEPETVSPVAEPKDTSSSDIKVEDEQNFEVKPIEKCKLASLPPAPTGRFSLFATSDFRDQFCRCASCFPALKVHPQLLEEEEPYEPPLSDGGSDNGSTHGSGSLYDRGESALKNVDRVRAIEGVMAYNHLKERLKPFFQQFAESGKAIGAEDIKEYFAKLRGDEQAIKDAGESAKEDHRQEQSGY